ncbi:penicillin-binding protein [Ureibacillus manganicus]|uniref:Penicillin-binding protein n=1 Tax=Ureibacillus manganicus DSM 26584 TaxID=1384049 RepID=A0A0A3I6P0_9BACL|nr:penicillin-binding protein [Ureibacillus manganicus]KGR80446.1 penicillin-binding protein [Ureibacillus manganicus DSM 26584]
MLFIYGGLFFALFVKIVHIQATGVVNGQVLEARAAALYEKEAVLTAERGKILDRSGNIIAEDTLSYRLIAVVDPKASKDSKKGEPRHVTDPQTTAKILAKYIQMDEADIYKNLTKKITDSKTGELKQPYQVEFGVAGRSISHEVKTAIEAEKLPGIVFSSDSKRYYPNGPFASHLVGFALKEEQDDKTFKTVGKMGLELFYNEQLTGVNGSMQYKSDAFHYLLPNSEQMVTPAKHGSDIYLTIDKSIQNFLEETMTEVFKEYEAESMIAVIADPDTGEILAMSQRPTFNPENRIGLEDWLNTSTQKILEPGSTMKIFTLASAIDTGNWHPNAFFQSGSYTVFDRTIRDHNYVGWGPITYLEGIQRSSNTAMAYMLEDIGNDTFVEYLDKFGFGKPTGIDLPGEVSGKIKTDWAIDYVTTSYGQGSTVTPIQLIQAMTAIANDGKMMQPYVIEKVVDSEGKIVQNHEPTVKGNPISEETAKQVREVLASTLTSEVGTAKKFAIDGYEVAGKTGTAYIADTDGSGQYLTGQNNYLYSFLGLAPADDPQLIMYVAVKRPQLEAGEYGSDPVSKVFTSVMENSLKYLNINPENVAKVDTIKMGDYVSKNAYDIEQSLIESGLNPIIIGDGGKIVEQYPSEGLEVTKGSLVYLKTDGAITIPDFTNWSLRNVLIYKTMSGLNIEIAGEGYVESQSVSKGLTVNDSSLIVLNLKTPEETFLPPIEENLEVDDLPQD